ncbi:tRNA pseudouridine(55) synthase TruB, partial [candidate division WWE3 bacterium RBG_19FT_COMBO_34_6]
SGWTSFDIVAKIKSMLNKSGKKVKIGHAGTLDPLAEGVLIVLTGNDTKKQNKIMEMNKEYICEISFGATSPTYDLEKELTYIKIPKNLDIEKKLDILLQKYCGEIEQKVPLYSAVKQSGTPLYKKARKNNTDNIILPSKKINIYEIEKLGFYEKNKLPTIKLRVLCSKGTYIRSLANDLGIDLGIGGVLVSLTRSMVGEYKVEDSIKIGQIIPEQII